MFTTTFVYLTLTFFIFWSYCGYFLTLYLLSLFGNGNSSKNRKVEIASRVSLLVPCFNEEGLVSDKVANIRELNYPEGLLDIYFLDGSSTDKTVERLREETGDMDNVKIVETGLKGKILQINSILPELDTDIVVNSDMDTLLGKNALIKIIRTFEKDEEVAVAGMYVMPETNYDMELQYWHDQNLMRLLESKVHSSSIVIAPCYAFRAGLLEKFPDDCIADDIYISFYANAMGWKSKYISSARAYETRTPSNLEEVFQHKFRKGNAYIIELLRFLYLLPVMDPKWKVIYFTKFLQVIVMPWVIPFFMLSTISQALSGIGHAKLPAFALIFLLMSFLITSRLFSTGRGMREEKKYKKRSLPVFFITIFILLLNGLTFPFYRQTSNYEKINAKEKQ